MRRPALLLMTSLLLVVAFAAPASAAASFLTSEVDEDADATLGMRVTTEEGASPTTTVRVFVPAAFTTNSCGVTPPLSGWSCELIEVPAGMRVQYVAAAQAAPVDAITLTIAVHTPAKPGVHQFNTAQLHADETTTFYEGSSAPTITVGAPEPEATDGASEPASEPKPKPKPTTAPPGDGGTKPTPKPTTAPKPSSGTPTTPPATGGSGGSTTSSGNQTQAGGNAGPTRTGTSGGTSFDTTTTTTPQQSAEDPAIAPAVADALNGGGAAGDDVVAADAAGEDAADGVTINRAPQIAGLALLLAGAGALVVRKRMLAARP